jgi:thymidylate synthase (FAD)
MFIRKCNVELIDYMGSDKSVVNAARVSFAKDKMSEVLDDRDESLIRYLARHNHWTPFAHNSITLRITAPIPIRTQCFKHKFGFVENEQSRRYISIKPDIFAPEFREAVASKKQGSGEVFDDPTQGRLAYIYREYAKIALSAYQTLLEQGVCEEQARFILPQGMMTTWYWTGSLAAYARFYRQRTDPHAQVEIQDLATRVGEVIEPLFPISWKALTEVSTWE